MKAWADLTSAERLDAVLLATAALCDDGRVPHAGAIATRVSHHHAIELAGMGRNGHCNGMRRMSIATRVTPAITALRKRGLLTLTTREDGRSGSADRPTAAGWKRVRQLERADSTTEDKMESKLKQRVALVKEKTGYVEDDRPVLEHHGFTYGDRVRVIEDDEDNGIFEGEEGYVVISEVGDAKYRNVRTYMGFLADRTDSPNECNSDLIEQL